VLESNPNAYIWAGRDFHQRPQQGINDYFWMNHDGQGAGVKNFDIGGVQFDVAAVSQVESCSPEVMADEANPSRITCTGGSGTGDNGHYALTTKTHNIKAGPIDVEVYANYGFDSKAVDSDERLDAWQGGLVLSHTNDSGVNKVILRYSDNSDNSVYNKTDDLTAIYASFEGLHKSPGRRRSNICWPSTTMTTARTTPITVKTTAPSSVRCTSGTMCTPPGWKRATSASITTRAAITTAGS
jgi:maltoporin